MALDLDRVANTVATFHEAPAKHQAHYRVCAAEARAALAESLPALTEVDQAAISWYIATLFASLRDVPLHAIADVVLDTAVGYSLGTAQLLGMVTTP